MNFFASLIAGIRELRELGQYSTLGKPGAWLFDAFGAVKGYAGVSVTPKSSLTQSTVWACVRVLSESVASLPVQVYKRLPRGKEKATELREYRILHTRPNSEMTAFVFYELAMLHVLLWGNFYAEKQYDGAGRLMALWPLPPWQVTPERGDFRGQVTYKVLEDDGTQRPVQPKNIIHVPGLSFDGLCGQSVITNARQSIGAAMATEEFGARWFGSGSRPSGLLKSTVPNLTDAQKKALRESWQEAYGGASNAGKTPVLAGIEWQQISIPPDDAQFIETKKFNVPEICRWFRVPPHMVADLERATFSNIEHQSLEFVRDTLRPWLRRFEDELTGKLFDGDEDFFVRFNVDGMLRGDFQTRMDGYTKGRQWGWLSVNDVRELEDMNALPGDDGDQYLVPMNMTLPEKVGQEPATPATESGGGAASAGSEGRTAYLLWIKTEYEQIRKWERFNRDKATEKLYAPVSALALYLGQSDKEKISACVKDLSRSVQHGLPVELEIEKLLAELGGANAKN